MKLARVDVNDPERIERTGVAAFERAHSRDPWVRAGRVLDRVLIPIGVTALSALQLVTVARVVFSL